LFFDQIQDQEVNKSYSFSEYQALVGQKLGVSDWMAIDQDRVNGFADMTDDHQFIHVDSARAKETPFGGTIAHGYLTLSLISKFASEVMPGIEGVVMGINYGLNRVRFLSPVKVGQSIRACFSLKDVKEKSSGQYLSAIEIVIEVEGQDKPACIAEWLYLAVSA
jgi:acyl dehydratase